MHCGQRKASRDRTVVCVCPYLPQVPAEQRAEVLPLQHQALHERDGHDGGGARLVGEQRALPEVVLVLEPEQLLLLPLPGSCRYVCVDGVGGVSA